MWTPKVVPFLVLCLVGFSVSSPVLHNLNEGRGIGSTIWDWITYPFTWWSYGENDISENVQLAFSSNNNVESIEIGKRNVTVWCNDQTCTTMRCDKFGCTNLTCNIYDTDLNGECRIYNTLPSDEDTPKPIETQPKPVESTKPKDPENKPIEIPTKPTQPELKPMEAVGNKTESMDKVEQLNNSNAAQNNDPLEERPIELEMMLSATVNDTKSTKDN
ncbi:unnamed protein product [Pieris macdunnoughi]|uniref:Uncharacterized protein n=1 Tax=Pieris macdunnoughi TaxID=345717 RepID=A0A821WXY8_9NEOP|nr:unnamed protein product [Pieris macdunnoughi]